MQLHYTRLDDGYYRYRIEWWDPESGDHHLDPECPQQRGHMVTALCGCIVLNAPKQVEIYIDGANQPILLNPKTVRDIVEGKRTSADLTFGASLYTMHYRRQEPIRWFGLRPMPGQQGVYECPACGRGARVEGNLHCEKCGLSFICSPRYWGVSVDLLDSLHTNKGREKYYIDRPWNDHPPWMSREELRAYMEDE